MSESDHSPKRTRAVIVANKFIEALLAAGVIPENCRRVVIDLGVNDIGIVYYETYADQRLLEVITASPPSVKIEEGDADA